MKINRNIKFMILVAAILVTSVGIAYALLSTTLNVTISSVTQSAMTWDIKFVGTPTVSSGGTSATGRTCGAATIDTGSLGVTVASTTLSKPADKCIYTLQIKNSGTVAAKLGSIGFTGPTEATSCTSDGAQKQCGNITYTLATNNTGTNLLAVNSTLAADETKTVYLIMEYTGEELNETAVTHTGSKFTLGYVQQ